MGGNQRGVHQGGSSVGIVCQQELCRKLSTVTSLHHIQRLGDSEAILTPSVNYAPFSVLARKDVLINAVLYYLLNSMIDLCQKMILSLVSNATNRAYARMCFRREPHQLSSTTIRCQLIRGCKQFCEDLFEFVRELFLYITEKAGSNNDPLYTQHSIKKYQEEAIIAMETYCFLVVA